MNGLKNIYQDISPVTLHLSEERVTSQLYCSSSEGMHIAASSLVEAFLVEVYRCRVCQYTSGVKDSIINHVADRHNLGSLTCFGKCDEAGSGVGLEVGESEALNNNSTSYDLESELHSKDQIDHMGLERMSFLLPMYGILPNMSPRSCDIGLGSTSEANLHVGETCEVSTLFSQNGDGRVCGEGSVFQLRDSPEDLPDALSCPDMDDEVTAQSAHLMTLGLCRISNSKGTSHQLAPAMPESKPASGLVASSDLLDDNPPSQVAVASSEMLQQVEVEEEELSCLLCHTVLPSQSSLDLHVKCHSGPQGFMCPRCGKESREWPDMERHWHRHGKKKGAKMHKCTTCHKTFVSEESRRAHEKKHKWRRRWRHRHRANGHASSLTQCPSCQEWCKSSMELDLHKHCHYQGSFKCLHCDYIDGSWRAIYKHMQAKHRKLEKGTRGKEQHSAPKVNTQSPKSLEVSTWYQPLKRREKPRRGAAVLERDDSRKGPSLTQLASLPLKKKPGARKEFCCTLCDRKFSTKMTMRRHMGIHQGDKPFECPHCDYCTRLKASLEQHLRVHTGEKPFKCTQCSYASIDRSSLRRHSRTHTQEKPYCCQYCPYSSIQKKSLDLHVRRHHTGESFPCHLCKYTTPDRQLLLRHVRKHHSAQGVPMLGSERVASGYLASRQDATHSTG